MEKNINFYATTVLTQKQIIFCTTNILNIFTLKVILIHFQLFFFYIFREKCFPLSKTRKFNVKFLV